MGKEEYHFILTVPTLFRISGRYSFQDAKLMAEDAAKKKMEKESGKTGFSPMVLSGERKTT